MYIQFIFNEGNPYIATTNKRVFEMFCKYGCTQVSENTFLVIEKREWLNNRKSYEGKKELAQAIAIEWQNFFGECNYSYGELSEWQSFFEDIGKKYGLIREFRENAII